MTRIVILVLGFLAMITSLQAQVNQVSVPRIDMMPDLPTPYMMRDWDDVTQKYDAFVFDLAKTGEHLPLVSFRESGINYPELKPIQLDTYVGTNSNSQAEAINIIPAIVGASLVGIDKSNQDGINWAEKTKDFFNSKNGQLVYLNGYNTVSGNDWWYDLMPNIFFFQLSTLYNDPDYDAQIISVADRWLSSVEAMGASTKPWTVPNMNYRGWYLSSMTGNAGGVHEPEAAGAIGWLLYHAWVKTSDEKYLIGAQHALEYLSKLNSNPSYELMLPYGTLAAAKMNATIGTNYNIDKMLNWSFDRGALRGWGTIVGTWNGYDVSGLIGEANDTGNDYAFLMNGYQQVAALAPMIKYDKRYARAIAKWILNLANASRLLYPQFLDPSSQDDFAWSTQHDPSSVIAYEALKEKWEGKSLYGTGDAKRNNWAETNLGLYGSSHVGYLAAVVDLTNVDGILQLDLNATDFFGDQRHPVYAYYNPHASDKTVEITLDDGEFDLYDAISETVIADNVSGNHSIIIKADKVMLITVLPGDVELTEDNGKLLVDDFIVDYHKGYDFTTDFRLKALVSEKNAYEFGETIEVYATTENYTGDVTYTWYVNNELIESASGEKLSWTAPSIEDTFVIRVTASNQNVSVSGEVEVTIQEEVPEQPVINGIINEHKFYYKNEQVKLVCAVDGAEVKNFSYEWTIPQGIFEQNDSVVFWIPSSEGLHGVSCKVTNQFGLSSTATSTVLVKNSDEPEIEALAYYPLNINTEDYTGHNFHAQAVHAGKADDPLGVNDFAYQIISADDIIRVPNAIALNFVDQLTVSCWIKISATGREAFILSHGSWEERWKLSLTPDLHIRWTVKTSSGVKDLDSQDPVVPGTFFHVTAVYSGYSLELYINGELDNYIAHTGSMLATDNDLTFGQKSTSEPQYYLNGVIDEVRIYNETVQPWQVATLKDIWTDEVPTGLEELISKRLEAYPNPVMNGVVRVGIPFDQVVRVNYMDLKGRLSELSFSGRGNEIEVNLINTQPGLIILEIVTLSGERKFVKLLTTM